MFFFLSFFRIINKQKNKERKKEKNQKTIYPLKKKNAKWHTGVAKESTTHTHILFFFFFFHKQNKFIAILHDETERKVSTTKSTG